LNFSYICGYSEQLSVISVYGVLLREEQLQVSLITVCETTQRFLWFYCT